MDYPLFFPSFVRRTAVAVTVTVTVAVAVAVAIAVAERYFLLGSPVTARIVRNVVRKIPTLIYDVTTYHRDIS